jgi:hypothetical protein
MEGGNDELNIAHEEFFKISLQAQAVPFYSRIYDGSFI